MPACPKVSPRQLTLDRDFPHGNIQVSLIKNRKLLSEIVWTSIWRNRKPGNSWVNSLRNSTSSVTKAVVSILQFRYTDLRPSLGYTTPALLVGEEVKQVICRQFPPRPNRPAVDCRGRACDYDDEYGTSSRRNETCYTKSIGSPRWGSFQIFRRTS